MSRRPLVSVVIPSYNHVEYVGQAIQSVFLQTYRNLELIVVDDGSKDLSLESIERELGICLKKRKIPTQVFARANCGAHQSLNFGIGKARGDYVALLNSDDYFFPKRIELLLEALKESKSELGFSKVRHVDAFGKRLLRRHPMRSWYERDLRRSGKLQTVGFRLLLSNITVTTGNFLFTRKLFQTIGEFQDLVLMHDYDFVLRALFHTEPVFVNRELMAYRVHGYNTCVAVNHLHLTEGPRVASGFFKTLIFNQRPANPRAPCRAFWGRKFDAFWKTQSSWLRDWVGGEVPVQLL